MSKKLSISELQLILEQLEKGEIGVTEAKAIAFNKKEIKPWATKEWQEIRARRIKDYCEKCFSKEGPFTLQHLWHNMRQESHRNLVMREKHNKYIIENISNVREEDIENFIKINGTLHEVCPECTSRNILARKTLHPPYLCLHCKATFDKPVKKKVLKKLGSSQHFRQIPR